MSACKPVPAWPFVLLLVVLPAVRADAPTDAAVKEDERLVREAKVNPDAPGLLAFFRKRTLKDADRETMARLVRQLGSRSFAQREAASRQLESWGPPALAFLMPARLSPDIEVARRAQRCIDEITKGPGPALPAAAARLLALLKPPEGVAVLLAYLPYADDESVREAVLEALLALADNKERQAPLRPALTDPLVLKRAAAGYVLGRSSDKAQRAAVRKLLADKEEIVRLRTAQGLLAANDKEAVPALIALLDSPIPDLLWQVEEQLLRIAGEEGPAAPASTDAKERQLYRERWAKWWEANAARVDLAKVAQTPPLRGWTVIAQMSTSKVYEIDRQGKVRWTIGNLSGPIDAYVLPGERVLIAEHHGSRVTERNMRGDILWERKLGDRPVAAQRLPNGNTFIATYSSVLEVTRGGKEVYHYRPDGTAGRIYGGCKMRNGRIICVTLEGRVLEIDSINGKVLKSFASGLNGCYSVQGLPGGRYLVASYNEGKVYELDAAGKVVWQHVCASAYHAERLPNGHTLIASHGQSRVIEVDRKGNILSDHGTNNSSVWRVHRR
jgi:HEAT repeat protein